MAAPTNAAKREKKLLPTRSRPHMARLRHADPPMNVGFQGQSGSNADIAEPSLLTLMRHVRSRVVALQRYAAPIFASVSQ
jgi:hypothetical protein